MDFQDVQCCVDNIESQYKNIHNINPSIVSETDASNIAREHILRFHIWEMLAFP